MDFELGVPLPGRIEVGGRSHVGNLAINLSDWSFETYDSSVEKLHELRFLTPVKVKIVLDSGKTYFGIATHRSWGSSTLFAGTGELEEV